MVYVKVANWKIFFQKNDPNEKQATTNKWILFSLQSSMLAVSETPVVEQFHKWMAATSWFETSIEGELTQLKSVLQQPCGEATKHLLYSIRVGVLLVPEHTWPTGSTDGPIDAGMAKEGRGLMTCISYLVSPVLSLTSLVFVTLLDRFFNSCYCLILLWKKNFRFTL